MGTTDAASEDRINADPNIALCKMVIERGDAVPGPVDTGAFELVIQDEQGEPTAARVGIYQVDTGWSPKPGADAVRMRLLGLEQEEFYQRVFDSMSTALFVEDEL